MTTASVLSEIVRIVLPDEGKFGITLPHSYIFMERATACLRSITIASVSCEIISAHIESSRALLPITAFWLCFVVNKISVLCFGGDTTLRGI